jgi:hypothetical protein
MSVTFYLQIMYSNSGQITCLSNFRTAKVSDFGVGNTAVEISQFWSKVHDQAEGVVLTGNIVMFPISESRLYLLVLEQVTT